MCKKLPKKPPNQFTKSLQYDLFTRFVANDGDLVSNTIELWQRIPKYIFTARQVAKLRNIDGYAEPFEKEFIFNKVNYSVLIRPAQILQKDGSYKHFFPSITEELIEEVLLRFLSEQYRGIHNPSELETWVKFSLSMIRKELKERGKSRSIKQIKQAIDVMRYSNITVYENNKELFNEPLLTVFTVTRKEYIENRKSLHIARLPYLISLAINNLEYRQFNYDRMMRCKEQLSRWLYKHFVHRYKQASVLDDYHFMYQYLKENTGLLEQAREIDNRRKVLAALKELKSQRVLIQYTSKEKKRGRTIIDVVYTVTASLEFEKEQKAANKRARIIMNN